MKRQQAGMSLIVALFLIVVVALLAAFAVGIGTSQRAQTNLQLSADRAAQAAHAGLEWAATRAIVNKSCLAPSPQLNLTQGALNGYRVSIDCTSTSHTEGAVNYKIYTVKAFAQYGSFGAAGYVSKTLLARFTDAP